jgi:hypothetical protein
MTAFMDLSWPSASITSSKFEVVIQTSAAAGMVIGTRATTAPTCAAIWPTIDASRIGPARVIDAVGRIRMIELIGIETATATGAAG